MIITVEHPYSREEWETLQIGSDVPVQVGSPETGVLLSKSFTWAGGDSTVMLTLDVTR